MTGTHNYRVLDRTRSDKPLGGSKKSLAPAVLKSHTLKSSTRSYDFTKVTAPSEAEETSAAYFENTPRL